MKKAVQLFPSGISIIDSAWGGLYRGGTYLLVGERKTGKTLLSIQFAVETAKQKEVCLFFTNTRPKDLMIQAASIDVDLEYYMNQNFIIVVRVAPPPEPSQFGNRDDYLGEYLSDIITVVNQYKPSRLVFDEITPYVEFEDPAKLREIFSNTFEQIEDLGVTSLLSIREPASASTQMIFNILNTYATGVIQLYKNSDVNGSTKSGIIDIQPNIGHTEGRFKAHYSIEPYKGIITDFKTPKIKETDKFHEKIGDYIPLSDIKTSGEEIIIPNFYSLDDFKLILNNQIAMYKTTGQVFTLVSFKLTNKENRNSSLTISQLKNVIRISSEKKDKICQVDDQICVLLIKEDPKSISDFINKIKLNLPTDEANERELMASDVFFYYLKVSDSVENADQMLAKIHFDVKDSVNSLSS
ncbi:KaiC-like protein [Ignavibacterium album JCM 16511]|uniref:KaiC-like protein n=1 Tax=Ignavibacterium album (strain DSM 19864 / JCM 16511 / NBRC 101810 / Mat9-16) TaxID=945713 RepID=I0AL79_IGNAJ|nr:ATPase domain-containing protein [Ignavibacterium album]AFH49736.1 KaiC-like protein [Ignavibacterium album JCM 16511]